MSVLKSSPALSLLRKPLVAPAPVQCWASCSRSRATLQPPKKKYSAVPSSSHCPKRRRRQRCLSIRVPPHTEDFCARHLLPSPLGSGLYSISGRLYSPHASAPGFVHNLAGWGTVFKIKDAHATPQPQGSFITWQVGAPFKTKDAHI